MSLTLVDVHRLLQNVTSSSTANAVLEAARCVWFCDDPRMLDPMKTCARACLGISNLRSLFRSPKGAAPISQEKVFQMTNSRPLSPVPFLPLSMSAPSQRLMACESEQSRSNSPQYLIPPQPVPSSCTLIIVPINS